MVSIRRWKAVRLARSESRVYEFSDQIYRYVFARVGHAEDAEDITMEVMLAGHRCPEADNLQAFLIGTAKKKVVDHFRRSERRKATRVEPRRDDVTQSDDFLRVQSTLQGVAENYREHLILKYVCGYSSEEVAEILGTTPTAVDNTLQRARKAFAAEWNHLNGDDHE